jgi:uncharacterized repeat protein (TIGR03803 family)
MHATILRLALIAACVLMPGGATAYTYKVLHDFCSKRLCADGETPRSGLIADAAGNLYGTSFGNVSSPAGSVYELIPNGDRTKWKLVTLHNFTSKNRQDGVGPVGAPILDASGNIYATTMQGGPELGGVVFELIAGDTPTRYTYKLLASFGNDPDGAYPQAALSYQGATSGAPYDGTSPLYGTTTGAGTSGAGTVFRLTNDAGNWTADTIYRFCALQRCADGRSSYGGVLVDTGGNLVGTTVAGGEITRYGSIYRLSDTGGVWTETVAYGFCAQAHCTDGNTPFDGQIVDALGNIYGTALAGGKQKRDCCGTLYRFQPDDTYNTLYAFCSLSDCRDGVTPRGPVVMDVSGTIFGAAQNGGGNNGDQAHVGGGTVFAWNGTALSVLYRFCAKAGCRDGAYPNGGLVMDADGHLFGTTQAGGKYGAGVVFELSP